MVVHQICTVPGCAKLARSRGSKLCEMHYARKWRHGSTDLKQPKGLIQHTAGYRLVLDPSHPLTTKGQSYVYEHRKVFYDAKGEGPFRCHVCGAAQSWGTMHVDHLDDDPGNNEIGNLAPACPECNQWRGKDRSKVAGQANIRRVFAFGEECSISEWSRRYGVPRSTITRRLAEDWQPEVAISTASGPTGRKAAEALLPARPA